MLLISICMLLDCFYIKLKTNNLFEICPPPLSNP